MDWLQLWAKIQVFAEIIGALLLIVYIVALIYIYKD